jgi:hypothetical protein
MAWEPVKLFIWESAEISVTIMAACIPALRIFIVKNIRSFVSRAGYGSSSSRRGTAATHPMSPRHNGQATKSCFAVPDGHHHEVVMPSDDKGDEAYILQYVPATPEQAHSVSEAF